MHYTYKAAWTVVGGINLPKDSQPIEIYRSEHIRFVLTNNPDKLLADIDRGAAINHLMMKDFITQHREEAFNVALQTEIEKIRVERTKKIGFQSVFLVDANGEIDTDLTEPLGEHEDFIIVSNETDMGAVAQIHKAEIEAMKLAVSLESEIPSRFAFLSGGTYLTSETGKIVYSLNFSMSAETIHSRGLSPEGSERISARYDMLRKAYNLESVERLFSRMLDYRSDRLKAFIFGWAALEILISKVFKSYENIFFSPLTNAGQPTLREKFLERLKDVMKDKYRLTDKFIAVTAVLFPIASDIEIQDDFKKFKELKQLRDSIYHGDKFSDKDLPIHEIIALFRKFILAYVAMPNPVPNS